MKYDKTTCEAINVNEIENIVRDFNMGGHRITIHTKIADYYNPIIHKMVSEENVLSELDKFYVERSGNSMD